jgi:hypothetical protein
MIGMREALLCFIACVIVLALAACGRMGYDGLTRDVEGDGPGIGVAEDGGLLAPDGAPSPGTDGAPVGGGSGQEYLSIVNGEVHGCAINSGRLYCWGNNGAGALGTGGPDTNVPVQVGVASDWMALTAGNDHTCGIRSGGQIYCWGDEPAEAGLIGTGSDTPESIGSSRAWVLTDSGRFHSCFIDDVGGLFCVGRNDTDQLGQGGAAPNNYASLVQVGDVADEWVDVSGGQDHSCGVQADGTLWCWGWNDTGELGTGGGNESRPRQVGTGTDWAKVACGGGSTCAIRTNGDLWCWGDNWFGQLGTGDRTNRSVPTLVSATGDWTHVDMDNFGSCGLREPGQLYCWGRSASGVLGYDPSGDQNCNSAPCNPAPTRVGLAGLGGPEADFVEVWSGRFHTCAKRVDGQVYCAGLDSGRIGDGSSNFEELGFVEISFP